MIIGIDASRAFGYDRTGTENYSYHLINHILRLPTSRTHHFVLFTRPGAIIPDWVRVSHTEVVTLPRKYLWTQIGLAQATWHKYLGKRLDILWVPAHTLPILRRPGIKTVVTIHGLEYQWLPEYKNILQRWYLPLSTYYAARSADHLIAVSSFTKQQLMDLGTPPKKISVIYEGVDISRPVGRRVGISVDQIWRRYQIKKKKYILFVGTVQPRKNLVSLIAAFSRATMDIPDIKLVVAGARGWMTEDIYRAPVNYKIQDKVIFTGRVSDAILEDLYSQAKVVVQPSIQEGFGLPILEAMAHDVPVIVSSGGALPEVVGEAGVVVPLGDHFVRDFASQLVRVVRDHSACQSLVIAGRKRVRTFGWEVAAQKTLSTLISLR